MATVCTNQSGASLGRYPLKGVTGRSASSSLGSHVAVRKGFTAGAPPRRKVPRGTQWGQLDGPGASPRRLGAGRAPPGSGRSSRPRPLLELLCPSGRATASRAAASLTAGRPRRGGPHDSYLVDSASSHMLVSKIKPCMSKYKQLYCETANGSLNQLSFI